MIRIREGNDFVHLMSIVRGGASVDLTQATNISVCIKSTFGVKDIDVFDIVSPNVVRIEFTPEILDQCGVYNVEVKYKVSNGSYADGSEQSAVDVDTFEIVPKSQYADDITELATTAEMLIGLKGEKWNKGDTGETPDISFSTNDSGELIATVTTIE